MKPFNKILILLLFLLCLSTKSFATNINFIGGSDNLRNRINILLPQVASVLGIYVEITDLNIVIIKNQINSKICYCLENNTLYLSSEYLEDEVLAHELAHVVVSKYIPYYLPAKTQEILAGWVAYQARIGKIKS